jgi:hypothetical protein
MLSVPYNLKCSNNNTFRHIIWCMFCWRLPTHLSLLTCGQKQPQSHVLGQLTYSLTVIWLCRTERKFWNSWYMESQILSYHSLVGCPFTENFIPVSPSHEAVNKFKLRTPCAKCNILNSIRTYVFRHTVCPCIRDVMEFHLYSNCET